MINREQLVEQQRVAAKICRAYMAAPLMLAFVAWMIDGSTLSSVISSFTAFPPLGVALLLPVVFVPWMRRAMRDRIALEPDTTGQVQSPIARLQTIMFVEFAFWQTGTLLSFVFVISMRAPLSLLLVAVAVNVLGVLYSCPRLDDWEAVVDRFNTMKVGANA